MWNEPSNRQDVYDVSAEKAADSPRLVNLRRSYKPGLNDLSVYLNGVLLRRGVDYMELNRYTIEFTEDLVEGDQVVCEYHNFG